MKRIPVDVLYKDSGFSQSVLVETTLFKLIQSIQDSLPPGRDDMVVAIVSHLLAREHKSSRN